MAGTREEHNHTIMFLRMAAVEMRRLAERAPEIGAELNHMARQLATEADAIEASSRRSA